MLFATPDGPKGTKYSMLFLLDEQVVSHQIKMLKLVTFLHIIGYKTGVEYILSASMLELDK